MSATTLTAKTCTSRRLISLSFYKGLCAKKIMDISSIFSQLGRRQAFFAEEQAGQASEAESQLKITEKGQAVPSNVEKKPRPLLKKGSSGNDVLYLQQSLAKLGYNPGPIDGVFGPLTEQAVRSFQTAKGLAVDGIVGPITWSAIESALDNLHPLLKNGSTGSQVIYLQQALLKLGFNPGPIDGIFGSSTAQAVRSFQKAKGLLVDGIVGPNTWAVIESALAKLPEAHSLLKKGSTGSEVVYLQQSLFKLGFNPGAADGIFGDRTEQAVKSFQYARGLAVDGIVGPLSWPALDKALAAQAKVLSKAVESQTTDKKSLASKLFGFFTKD